ncbi:aldo/keto reductase [Catalinimonas sp. 4WD22]|uniref:aldo/keto reductase n=1 Tax=Catalinimonas locisalis TaxID=3133978 RepID=UPI0031018314
MMKTNQLHNGDKVPSLGLGTWKSEPGKVYEAVLEAIRVGYRHIDCAPIYENEIEVGAAIEQAIKQGLVRREELWITSKLWNSYHARYDVIKGLEISLIDLKRDYLDLYLVHWPVAQRAGSTFPDSVDDLLSLEEVPLAETWQGMEAVVGEGLVRHIGVSNFGIKNLSSLLDEATMQPVVNQVETHPYLQQNDLQTFCRENDISITAYSPLGSSDRPDFIRRQNEPMLLKDPVIHALAQANDCAPAQILIAYALQRENIVIPKSTHAGRILENYWA